MIKVIKRKPIKGIEEALREQIAYEKKVSKTFERMAIRLKQQVNELKAELCGMEDELAQANRRIEEQEAKNVVLRNSIKSMRWRIFTLLRSTDVDAEAIGLPRYTKPEADEMRSTEEICEIDPGEDGWWPKEGLFEQSGEACENRCRAGETKNAKNCNKIDCHMEKGVKCCMYCADRWNVCSDPCMKWQKERYYYDEL